MFSKLAFSVIFTLLSIIACSITDAWWGTGHLTVGAIAKMNLDQFTIDVVEAHFDYLAKFGSFPSMAFEGRGSMIQGASFPDDIKRFKVDWLDIFHFTNYPYKVPSTFSYPTEVCGRSPDDLINTFPEFVKAASIPENERNFPWVTSFAFAYIEHLMGDMHQPLHSAELYNQSYPTGDQGGNLIQVTCPGECVGAVTNLHSVWDSLLCTECSTVSRPFNASYMESAILSRARRINATFNNEPYELGTIIDPITISQEAFNLAVQYAYPGVVNNSVINQTYKDRGIPVAERQMLLAGMRLAYQLRIIVNTLYPVGAANRTVPDFTKMFAGYYPQQPQNFSSGDIAGIFIGGMIVGILLWFLGVFLYRKSNGGTTSENKFLQRHPQDYGLASNPNLTASTNATPEVNHASRGQKF
jgi:hypothetical protein